MRVEQTQENALEAKSPYELRVDRARDVPESDIRRALATGEMGFLHSFTTGSTVDGPGVRVVAWTTGCQFRCLYCHNPDTWNLVNGTPVTVARATEELEKYRHGLKVMKGGFTLSGGEPLMQDRFAVRLLSAAHVMGIHTALDTNGALGERLSDEELGKIDLVLLDIKSWSADRHKMLTGMDIAPVLNFASRLSRLRRPVWLRFVLVPGLTDHSEDIEALAAFAAGLGNIQRADVLPFHQLGKFKWKELKLNYHLGDVSPPLPAQVTLVRSIFTAHGLRAY